MKKLLIIASLLFATLASAQIQNAAAQQEAAGKFGEAMAKALNERDEKAMASLIDFRALATRAADLQDLNAMQRKQFVDGATSTASQRIVPNIIRSMEASEGTAKFMRATGSRPPRALVRLDLGDNGFDYLEYVIETRDGHTRAVDWFQLSAGELISDSIGGVAQLMFTDSPSVLGELLGVKNVDKSVLVTMRKFSEAQNAGKYTEALAAARQLPAPIANSRRMLRIQASLATYAKQPEEYNRILGKLAELYSDDPATAFILLDHHFLKKDLPNTLRTLDTMEKRVGVDAILRQMRANVYFSTGDFTNAVKYADESIRLEPERIGAYDLRGSALIELGRYADAIRLYQDLEKLFGLEFSRAVFEDDAAYAKFIKTPEFNKWLPAPR